MEVFLQENASAVFALLGAIFGSVFTGFIHYITKTKEVKLRIIEKLLDKKLLAHEKIIDVVQLIRSMNHLNGVDENNDLIRYPAIMHSHREMKSFVDYFMTIKRESDRWLPASLKREVNLFTDYLTTIKDWSNNSTDENMREVGVIIKYDFIKFASRIEDSAHQFFNNGLLKLNYNADSISKCNA